MRRGKEQRVTKKIGKVDSVMVEVLPDGRLWIDNDKWRWIIHNTRATFEYKTVAHDRWLEGKWIDERNDILPPPQPGEVWLVSLIFGGKKLIACPKRRL